MREPSRVALRNGGWLHVELADQAPAPRPRPARSSPPLAPAARRDRVYRWLAARLGLSDRHRRHLELDRGLPSSALAGFCTAPVYDRSRGLVDALVAELGPPAGVPGFYRHLGRWELAETAAGVLIPVRDRGGLVLALTVRADAPATPDQRYRPLSSAWAADRGGTGPGTPAAVWRPDLLVDGAWLTEGALKAGAIAWRLGVAAVGLAGVSTWRAAAAALGSVPAGYPVVVAFDADWRTNGLVGRHRDELADGLAAAGCRVEVAEWDWSAAKGADDALAAGLTLHRSPWRRRLAPPREPRRTRMLRAVGGH
jgi:Domain of unknown function (DUF3854)